MIDAAKLFLLGGQSNMCGSESVTDLPEPYDRQPGDIQLWDPERGWMTLDPARYSQVALGPELSFGHGIADRFAGHDVRFIKYAAGGTALYDDWSPVVKGDQYCCFMQTVASALADLADAGTDYIMMGMLWLQGESDAAEGQGESYHDNLTGFMAHIRDKFNTPDMPFIIARVLSYYGGETGQAELVRSAQVAIAEADKSTAWFDTDDCPVITSSEDRGHYTAEGILTIGSRFAETYEALCHQEGKA